MGTVMSGDPEHFRCMPAGEDGTWDGQRPRGHRRQLLSVSVSLGVTWPTAEVPSYYIAEMSIFRNIYLS